jgi:hypothetical protein
LAGGIVSLELIPGLLKSQGPWNFLGKDAYAWNVQCWNFRKNMGARNRVGTWWSYRPARLHRLCGINSLELIPGLLKSLGTWDFLGKDAYACIDCAMLEF